MKFGSGVRLMPISAKIPETLYKKLQNYKAERAIESDSEAIRTILRTYLLDIYPKERGNAVLAEGSR